MTPESLRNIWLMSENMNKLLFFGLISIALFTLLGGLASAGSLTITLLPNNALAFTLANGTTLGYGSQITILNGSSGNTLGVFYTAPYPSISSTLQITGCGASHNLAYVSNTIDISANAPACSANTVYPIHYTLSPSTNTITYTDSLSGANVVVNSTGFKANVNVTLNFTQSYYNASSNTLINPPKLSALNYYNKTINLNFSQNFTDQQLLLQVHAPKEPKVNESVNVIPSWTTNQLFTYDNLNLTINVLKIPPIGVNTILAPSAFYRNSTYGLNITAMGVNAFVFNTVLENAHFINSSYNKNCQHTFAENGTVICLDNLSSIETGQLIASHNISGGVTEAMLAYQNQCRGNYTAEVSLYNSTYKSYERQGDPLNPDSNLSICRASVATAQQAGNIVASYAPLVLILVILGLGGYYYMRRKSKERIT